MMISLDDWLLYLKQSQSAVGFPLVIGGLGLMLFGWRMWKVCVMLSYALLGAALGARIVGPCDNQWLYALAAGAGLGLASYWPVNYAVSGLGGLIGAAMVTHSLANLGVSGTALLASGGAAFIGCTAFAFLNRQHVVIVVTAFLGAALLVSGLAAWVVNLPGLYGTVRAMAAGSAIVIPFIVVVPTVMSSFYQLAEVRRLHVDL
ncbi:MAG: hypothetical protein JSU86_11785 [Phycisphaerales bacterium]|nr:MAG: hypothetical protein JSU86_11785 [Phycisphaerales bacterium]